MIQRIQTVYLFFVFCLMAILAFIPFYTSSSSSFITDFSTGYFAAAALLAIITVFLYKKRNLQIKICYVLLLIQVFAYVLFFIFDRQNLLHAEFFQHLRYTILFPFISIIFIYLAIRGIRKDEKLVRSLDRLR